MPSSVVDPYHFDLDPDFKIKENSNFFSSIKNILLKLRFFLLVFSLLFIHINQKSDLFSKILKYSYIFCRFFFTTRICWDPFSHYTIRIGSGSGQMVRIRIHNSAVSRTPNYFSMVSLLFYNGIMEEMDFVSDLNFKERLKFIHTLSVQSAINKQGENAILGTPAPNINASEKTLPRKTRATLAQLRSGYSSYLNAFMHRIKRKNTEKNCI